MTRVLLSLFAGLVLVLIAAFGYNLYDHIRAEREANTLVLAVTSGPLAQWDSQMVVDNANDSLLAETPEGHFPRYFRALSGLGNLLEIRDISYELDVPAWWQRNEQATAYYTMIAVFDFGDAEVRVRLLRQDNRWTITQYLVLTSMLAA